MPKKGYAQAIVASLTQPLLVLGADLRVELASNAFLKHFQVTADETEGRLVYQIGNGQWDIPTLRRLLDEVLQQGRPIENYKVDHNFENLGRRIMLITAHRMRLDGGPDRILIAITDVTEREMLVHELEGRREFGEKLIDSVREALVVLGWDLRVQTANQSFYEQFGVSRQETEGRLFFELGNGQWDIPELRRLLEEVLPEKTQFDDYEVKHDFAKVGRRIMLLNGRRLDHLNLVLLAIRDVTEAHAARQRQQTLMGELQHRVKNILNNVSALAAMTVRKSRDLDEFYESFTARLHALARTQSLLVERPTGDVDIRDIIRLELEAIGAEEGTDYIAKGERLTLKPEVAQPLAMTIHELTTNAAKYGALSVETGKIDISWRAERRNDRQFLALNWRERGITIEDQSPEKGFGFKVIETTLTNTLDGSVEHLLAPDGAVCNIFVGLDTENDD
jgi:PAS domain S-box-containing protein